MIDFLDSVLLRDLPEQQHSRAAVAPTASRSGATVREEAEEAVLVAELNRQRPPGRSVMRTKRVLLVDDDPGVLEVIGLALERTGYEVLTAPDGDEGLKLLSDVWHPVPDAIVTDVCMPRRGGPELLLEMGSNLRFAGVRTILMSSDAMAGKNVRCDAFMTKDRVACELIDTLVRLERAPQ